MARPLNIKYRIDRYFADDVSYKLTFSQGNDELISPFLIDMEYPFTTGVEDPPNAVFSSVQNAFNYYKDAAATGLIDTVNSIANNKYELSGKFVYILNMEADRRFSALETGKLDKPAGTTSQYIRGDGSLATLPTGSTRTTSSFTLTPVNAGTGTTGGNTGTQVSSTKDSSIRVTFATQITYSLAGNVASRVILKKCSTNDPNEANWTACGRTATVQNTGLAVTVGQSVGAEGQICTEVPAGWFVKAVKDGTGTHTETFIDGEKTIFG